jgi:hypothetical protein
MNDTEPRKETTKSWCQQAAFTPTIWIASPVNKGHSGRKLLDDV